MKKNTILTISIIIILLIFFIGRTRTSNEELTFIESKQEITGHFVYEEIQDQEQPIGTPPEPPGFQIPEIEMVSQLRCIGDRIELFLTNPTDDTLILADNIKIHLNGMIVVDPKCSRYTLMPGKKVFCSDISGHLAIKEGKKNLIQIDMGSEKKSFKVNCDITNPSYEII